MWLAITGRSIDLPTRSMFEADLAGWTKEIPPALAAQLWAAA
jgi:hypothetical protein